MLAAFCLTVCQMGGEGGGYGGGGEGEEAARAGGERVAEYGMRLQGQTDTGEM